MVRAHEWETSRRLARARERRPWWAADPAPPVPPVRLEWESAGPHAVVVIEGDVDSTTCADLEGLVAEQPLTGCTVLELDLSAVPSLGPEGLAVLLGVRRWCLQRSIELRVRGALPSVWRTVEVAGLDRILGGPCPKEPAPQESALF